MAKGDLQQKLASAPEDSAIRGGLSHELEVGSYWLEQVTPQQYLDGLRNGRPIERLTMSVLPVRRRAAGAGAVCTRCVNEFDQDKHSWHMCTECNSEVCDSCGKDYLLKSAGESEARFICNVCEVSVRAKLGKMEAPHMPETVKTPEEQARGEEMGMFNPSLYASGKNKVARSDITSTRVELLKQQSKALSKRKTYRVTVRPMKEAQADALAQLRESQYFDTLNSQTWSHIAAMVPPNMVRPLHSVNTAMRDLLNGWAALLHFDAATVTAAAKSRQVVPGVNVATSHIGTDHIITLHYGVDGAKFQVYRFRPKIEPRFESPALGDHAPKFGLGAQLASDGTYIAVRGKSSSDVGKPVHYNVFCVERRGPEGRIHGIPHCTVISCGGVRGVMELLHREKLYVAYFDKAAMAYILEMYDAPTGKLERKASQPCEFAGAKVTKMVVEARHLYLLCVDEKTETPYLVISYTLDLVFESSFPLPEAPWDSNVYFCKHRAAYYDSKKQVVREIKMDIQRGDASISASYPVKLKRKVEIRHILMDSTRLVVITSSNQCVVFARSGQKLMFTFDLPSECVAIYPMQSHMVVITPSSSGSSASAMRTGLVSPRGGPSAAASGGNVTTQAEVYDFLAAIHK